MTVWENVALPLNYHRPAAFRDVAARVQTVLEAVDGTGWAQFRPSELRVNWCQRAGLARSLALQPEILILDNPLAGLDPRDARWWVDFVEQLHSGHPVMGGRPTTLVLATDDLRPWRLPECQFALLQEGRFICLEGPPKTEVDKMPLLRDLLAAEPSPL